MRNLRLGLYRGKWAAIWTGKCGSERHSFGLAPEEKLAALQRFEEFKDALKAPVGDTVSDIYLAYCDDLDARGKPSQRARDAWKALRATFGHLLPEQCDRPRCRAYTAHRRRQGRGDGTIGKELSTLLTALNWKDKRHGAQIEIPPRPKPRDRFLTRAEYRRLRLSAKSQPHVYLFVVLGIATAARREALLGLTFDQVDFARSRISLADDSQDEGRKARATVPMTRHARRVLRLAERLSVSGYVIEYGGRPVGDIKKAFAAACKRAGLEGVTPHVLRHTAAVWMAEAGVEMDEIARYLGHSDVSITRRVYAAYSPEYLSRAAAALE